MAPAPGGGAQCAARVVRAAAQKMDAEAWDPATGDRAPAVGNPSFDSRAPTEPAAGQEWPAPHAAAARGGTGSGGLPRRAVAEQGAGLDSAPARTPPGRGRPPPPVSVEEGSTVESSQIQDFAHRHAIDLAKPRSRSCSPVHSPARDTSSGRWGHADGTAITGRSGGGTRVVHSLASATATNSRGTSDGPSHGSHGPSHD
eukprot:gene19249-19208_t